MSTAASPSRARPAPRQRQTLTVSVPATRRGNIVGTWGHALVNGRRGFEASVVWPVAIGTRSNATLATRRLEGREVMQVAYQKSLPIGPGVGGRVPWTPIGDQTGDVEGMLQCQGERGRIELRREVFSGRAQSDAVHSVGVSGAIVARAGTCSRRGRSMMRLS